MSGVEEHIYVATFDEEINNYSCLYYGSKPNRTTFLYEYQFVKIDNQEEIVNENLGYMQKGKFRRKI